MLNIFLFSGLHLIQRGGRRLPEPNVCTPSWCFRSDRIQISEMIQIWCESLNRLQPRGLRRVWTLFSCSALFSKKTPISPLKHGRPVHAVRTMECRLLVEGQPPPEDCCFLSCLLESIDLPAARGSPRRLAYIGECQTHEAQRWKWQEKPVSPFFLWSSLLLQGGSETSVCRHESSVIAASQVTKRFISNTRWRFCSAGQNKRVKKWNGIIWSRICVFYGCEWVNRLSRRVRRQSLTQAAEDERKTFHLY